MEIKVGEYIRTKEGIILKVKKVWEDTVNTTTEYNRGNVITTTVWKDEIVKHSKNIIDLIEVGDYVNGERVDSINGILYAIRIGPIEDIEIKTILTHEQYEENFYKVVK